MRQLYADIREKEAEIIQRNKGKPTLSRAGLAREWAPGKSPRPSGPLSAVSGSPSGTVSATKRTK